MRSSALAAQRQQNFLRRQRGQKAAPVDVPSPIKGWNARDSVAAMDPEDAVTLDNWFPGLGSVSMRNGDAAYADTLGGTVKTLAEFNAGTLRKFLAGANGKIWNISASGAGVSLATGFGSDEWQTAQFDDSAGGARMGLVNGVDAPQTYNGAVIAAMVVSGPTVANLNGIHIYKSRSYFWDSRTQDFWYSATGALGGVLTKFPLGRVQGSGGNLIAMGTLSRDSGDGINDYAVFVFSSGDLFIYEGDDPGTAANWRLVNHYVIGAPIAKRAVKKIGADLVIVTRAGYISLASVLAKGRVNEDSVAISSKIRQAAIDATRTYAANFGWESIYYPARNQFLVNVPLSSTQFQQHVMNTETQAWCRFKGINAQCFGMFNDKLYYGTAAGTVRLADSGHSDIGAVITAEAQPAWNYLGDRRNSKRASGIRYLMRASGGGVSYQAGMNFDFVDISYTINNQIGSGAATSPWDSSPWDTSPWSDEFINSKGWCSAKGSGRAIGHKLRVISSTQSVEWFSTTFLAEKGGVL